MRGKTTGRLFCQGLLALSLTLAPPVHAACLNVFSHYKPGSQALRIGTFNVREFGSKKHFHHKKQIARIILEQDLDLLVLQEINGLPVLKKFSQSLLKNQYRVLMLPNHKGFATAFLIRKNLPFQYELKDNLDEKLKDESTPLFHRGLPTLLLRGNRDSNPFLILMGVHFKSKRDREGDPLSRKFRTAQANRTSEIIQRYQMDYGAETPVIAAGDFNSAPGYGREFTALWQSAHMEDAMNLLSKSVTFKNRITHTFHPRNQQMHARQIDAILVSNPLQGKVTRAGVHRYRDRNGKRKPTPRTYRESARNPSDHHLVWAEIQIPI